MLGHRSSGSMPQSAKPRLMLAAPTPNYRRAVNRTCRIIRVVDHTANDNSLAIPTFLLRERRDLHRVGIGGSEIEPEVEKRRHHVVVRFPSRICPRAPTECEQR